MGTGVVRVSIWLVSEVQGASGLLCACWVRWSIGVTDGQLESNGLNGENGENGENVENFQTPHNGENDLDKCALFLDDTWLSMSTFQPPHLELIPPHKGT
jgi:hypothetical protein